MYIVKHTIGVDDETHPAMVYAVLSIHEVWSALYEVLYCSRPENDVDILKKIQFADNLLSYAKVKRNVIIEDALDEKDEAIKSIGDRLTEAKETIKKNGA